MTTPTVEKMLAEADAAFEAGLTAMQPMLAILPEDDRAAVIATARAEYAEARAKLSDQMTRIAAGSTTRN